MYYDTENQVIINQSVKDFYIHFLFKIDALLQIVVLPLDINSTLFKKLCPDVRDLLISEGAKVPQRPPTETNHQVNQRLILVRNTAVEAENKIRKIKAAVKPLGGILHHRTFMSMAGGTPTIKTAGLSSIFQDDMNNYMVAEMMDEYALDYAEAAYKI